MNPEIPASSARRTPPRGVAWLRASLSVALWVAAVSTFGVGMTWISQGEFRELAGRGLVLFVAIPLVVVSAISTAIAVAFFRNSTRGVRAALVFDAMVVATVAIGFMVANRRCFSQAGFWMGAVPAIVFGAEAAWLLMDGSVAREKT